MSYFGEIVFNEQSARRDKVNFEAIQVLGEAGYRVQVPKSYSAMCDKDWKRLERSLLYKNIEYVTLPHTKNNPFEAVVSVDGQVIRRFAAGALLDYIYKYQLVRKQPMYAHVGIVVGTLNDTLDVVASIAHNLTSLTFFLNEPNTYKQVIGELYTRERLKAKAKIPCSTNLKEMDIVFDLSGTLQCAKWCKSDAIYIAYKNYPQRSQTRFIAPPPSIWIDFQIRCGRQKQTPEMLQAVFFSKGIYKRSFLNEFKKVDMSIDTVYTRCIS